MNTEIFKAKNGKEYLIKIDDEEEISVWLDNVKKGTISLRLIEGAQDFKPNYCHITHLALDDCQGQGIGRRCLQLHRELFNIPITAGNAHDGQMDDGSHLTGNGPGFILKMREEGLVVDDADEGYYNDDDC
ncbi:MAG: hypothetical protein Q7T25_09310 [Sideroxyarcus sp.]|nr:hypothetical protein [Sideroxyarcus sp.]